MKLVSNCLQIFKIKEINTHTHFKLHGKSPFKPIPEFSQTAAIKLKFSISIKICNFLLLYL